MTDRPADQPANRPSDMGGHRDVTIPINVTPRGQVGQICQSIAHLRIGLLQHVVGVLRPQERGSNADRQVRTGHHVFL